MISDYGSPGDVLRKIIPRSSSIPFSRALHEMSKKNHQAMMPLRWISIDSGRVGTSRNDCNVRQGRFHD
jgi:hypothetical protein